MWIAVMPTIAGVRGCSATEGLVRFCLRSDSAQGYGGVVPIPIPSDSWPTELADAIGLRVRHYRQALRMSVQQLSDAVAELGVTIGRPVLSNLETGRRHAISVPELFVLARALGVAPVLLLFPIGRDETMQVLPSQEMGTWQALKWFAGEGDFLVRDDAGRWLPDPMHDRKASRAVPLWRRQDEVLADWRRARMRAEAARKAADVPSVGDEERIAHQHAAAQWDRAVEQAERELRAVRREIKDIGLTPTELTPNLRHVDDEDGQD